MIATLEFIYLEQRCQLFAVIKGWDKGVITMKKGEKAILTCKATYAYGEAGSPPKIPPNATLNFEVRLESCFVSAMVTINGGQSHWRVIGLSFDGLKDHFWIDAQDCHAVTWHWRPENLLACN